MNITLNGESLANSLSINHFINRTARATLVAVSVACGALSANAALVTTAPGFGPYQIASGGEFTMIPDADTAAMLGNYSPATRDFVQAGSFQTFCVERNEFITANTTYEVTANNITMFTGIPLTVGAAYLYEQFATGNLAGYNYANTLAGSRAGFTAPHGTAYELQIALWYFMGQYSYNQYNIYMNGDVALPANAFDPDNGAHNVAILNLWTPGQPHDPWHTYQDVLIYQPTAVVPEPTTLIAGALLLLPFGSKALRIIRKRRAP